MRQTPPGPQLLATGETLRFCVGSHDGPRSNVWSVVGGRRTDEVYLAARDVMGSAKLSMHSSGRWRWAMTAEEVQRRQLDIAQDRVMLRWEQPASVAPGWTRAATISVPGSSLRSIPPPKRPRRGTVIYWAPDPGPCEVWFDIFVKRADADELTFNNITEPVGRIDLPSGGAVWVIGTEWQVTLDRELVMRDLRNRTRDSFIERMGADAFDQLTAPTGAGWGWDDDDRRPVVIDLGDLRYQRG